MATQGFHGIAAATGAEAAAGREQGGDKPLIEANQANEQACKRPGGAITCPGGYADGLARWLRHGV